MVWSIDILVLDKARHKNVSAGQIWQQLNIWRLEKKKKGRKKVFRKKGLQTGFPFRRSPLIIGGGWWRKETCWTCVVQNNIYLLRNCNQEISKNKIQLQLKQLRKHIHSRFCQLKIRIYIYIYIYIYIIYIYIYIYKGRKKRKRKRKYGKDSKNKRLSQKW